MPICKNTTENNFAENAWIRPDASLFVVTIFDGHREYALSLAPGECVDLDDYTCRAITQNELPQLKALSADKESYESLKDLLYRGLELHIWRRKGM